MKTSSTKVEINNNGEGEVYALVEGKYQLVGNIGNVIGVNSNEVNGKVALCLNENDIEIVSEQEQILNDQAADIQFVRTKMRQVARDLTDKNKSVEERKDLAQVYTGACLACKIIVDACRYEAQQLILKEKYE